MSLTAPPTIVLLLAGDTSHPDPDLDQNSTESVISLSLSWREEADGILLSGSGVFLSGGGRSCDNDRTA